MLIFKIDKEWNLDERINDLEKKVDDLTGDIGDIKSMLQSLITK